MSIFIFRLFNLFVGDRMYINRFSFNNPYKEQPLSKKTQATSFDANRHIYNLPNFCYRPIFSKPVSFKALYTASKSVCNNAQILQNSLQNLLTPVKKDFLAMKKNAIINSFNSFYDIEYGHMSMVVEPDFKFLFKDFKDPNFKNEQFSVRVVDLKAGEFDFAFFDKKQNLQRIKLKNNQFYSLDDTKTPLSYAQVVMMGLEEKFNDMIPMITQGVDKIDNLVSCVFNEDIKGYSLFLARCIKKRFIALNEFLNNIETEKRYALKRSYSKFIPHPNKTAFFLKDNDRIFSDRYAFLPHREGDESLFRIVQFDSNSNIKDAYLIDLKSGLYKNFCKRKIFNQKNVSVIPRNDEKMTSKDIKDTPVIGILETYLSLLDDFSDYVRSNSYKSAKNLLEQCKADDYVPYNKIKQNFIDRIKYILPDDKSEMTFVGSSGDMYSLKKSVVDCVNIIHVSRVSEKGEISVVLDADTYKMLEMHTDNKLVYDSKGNIKHIPHSSDAFKIRARILQEFINEAFSQNNFVKDQIFLDNLKKLKETFNKLSALWFSTYKNKKTEARKLFGNSFISAKGDTGGFRFAISDKDYSIGLKPHQNGKNRYMRLTVYNKNGEIINNFLLDNFSNVVDNYCSTGKYTKDSIRILPDNILYKNDEQIQLDNVDRFVEEYLTELNKFSEFFFNYMGKS